jgi:zinc transport system substrate-binding protein
MRRIFHLGCCLVILLVLLSGCGGENEKSDVVSDSKALSVYVVNYPLKYFAERIGEDRVEVKFPAPADDDPAYWSPGPDIIATYQEAGLVLLNGADYAKWISKVSMPSSKMVDTSGSFTERLIELEDQTTHSHGPEGKHAHRGWAFTTWLNPTLAVEQARSVKDALSTKIPGSKIEFANRFAKLEKDLLEIDKQLKGILSADSQRPIVFSHPVYQYFSRHYKLNSGSVHWEPDAMPDERMWQALIHLLNTHPAKWMIWEGTPLPEITERLAEMGITSVVFDPCAGKPEQGDFMSVMKQNVVGLQKVYGSQ